MLGVDNEPKQNKTKNSIANDMTWRWDISKRHQSNRQEWDSGGGTEAGENAA